MSSSSQTAVSSSQFESIISAALNEFKEKTGKNLLDDWLAKELQSCDSVEAVMDIIQGQAKAFDKFMNGGSKLMKWIRSSVHVLYTISAALGDSVGAAVPSAKAVFTGIGVLLAAVEDVRASHDALVDLFDRTQFFLKRLGVHTRISPTKDMVEILVKIMAEVIGILSIATKEMQRSKTKTYLRKLLGSTDIEDALKKLDSLTQEEVRMAIAQVLQGINELKDDTKKTNEAMQQIAEKVDKIQWNQIERDVRKWLSSPDPTVNYNIARRIYQEGTAVWFLEGSVFKEWDLIGSLLWIHGKPGSGKSIFCTSIIKHIISLCDAGPAALAYYYFDFRDEEKRNLRSFVTSLLTQLSDYSEHCRNTILHLYSTHGKGARQPDIDVLIDCLKEMLKVIARQPVYIIVDALDECPGMSGMPTPRETVLSLVEDLAGLQLPFLHLCITSRPEADIKEVLEPLAYFVVSLHDESGQQKDISDYVKAVVYSDRKMRKWRDEEKKLVVEELSNRVDGMFRWAFCQLEVLRHCLPASIRPTLDQLPETLDETYARVLSQIPQANQAHAHRLLQCLMVAVRPLRVEELAEVLAFEFDTAQGAIPRYRAGWQLNDQEQAVLSTCSSLISIVDDHWHGSQVVQFSHFSVKEFLTSDRLTSSLGNFSRYQINPGPAHTILAQACLGFLLHLDGHANELGAESSPLAKYAAQHWVTHARFGDVASRIKDGMESLFDYDKPHFAAWVGIYNIDQFYPTHLESPSKIPTPLYYSSLCGLSDLAEHLATKHPQHVNAIGGQYGFPLHAAIEGIRRRAAEIPQQGANVDIRGTRERVHKAIRDVNIVQSLLNYGADVNCPQDDLHTPLHLAARYGGLEVAQILLEHKANVHSRDNKGKTPFQLMFENGDDNYVDFFGLGKLLLKHGADVNTRDEDYNTPLYLLMAMGRYDRAEILLELGADPSAENDAGETPLHQLLEYRSTPSLPPLTRLSYNDKLGCKYYDECESRILDIVRLSLERGADVNLRTPNNWTLLHEAAFHGWPDVAKVLLDRGANVNAETKHGYRDSNTPLHVVSRPCGKHPLKKDDYDDAVQLLVEWGADINTRDDHQNTPLHSAVLEGRLEIVQVLLNHGASVVVENDRGKTPLHLVSESERDVYSTKGSVGVLQLLLERDVDVNATDVHQNTPLHSAAYQGKLEIAKVLLGHGANADAENDDGETPLHLVSRRSSVHEEDNFRLTRLLLDHGVDVNARNKNKSTPLHLAASQRNISIRIAQVLIDHGAITDAANDGSWTPLNLVSRRSGGHKVVRLLLERGVDVNTRSKNKSTPLHSAVSGSSLETAQLLLDRGANADAENDEGETPLHLVSQRYPRENDVRIARLLLDRGADVNARKKDNTVPLHLAASKKILEIVQTLLDHGANADAENGEGETPLDLVLGWQDSRSEWKDGHEVVRLLLERGVDVNTRNKNKSTPLHSAVSRSSLSTAQLLLDHGANADAKNNEGETPLHLVSRSYSDRKDGVRIAELLLDRGADVNARMKNNNTPLHLAASKGRVEITQVLLNHGATADAENDEGETPLNLVSQCYSEEDGVGITRLLLKHGVDANAQKKRKTTLLHSAAFKGRLKVVQMLLDHGAIADAENDEGETPLSLVSRGEYDHHIQEEVGVGIAQLLLDRGVDVNAGKESKTTPLHSAAFKGRLKIVQILLDHGAIADAENDEGETPLNLVSRGEYGSQEDRVGIAWLLLKRGVDVNARMKGKPTSLHSAAFTERLEIVKILLDHGAIADAENDEGETPLNLVLRGKSDTKYHASWDWNDSDHMLRGNYKEDVQVVSIVRLFLERGVDVNAQDKYHNTPLHSAAFNREPKIARLLLDHGANPNAENEQGETLLHEVSRIKDSSRGVVIARLLLEHGADVYAQDQSHNTALHSAAFEGRLRLAQVLLNHGANTTTENDQGETPLHLVSRGRYDSHDDGVSIAQLLLERAGVDVNGRKKNKWTPFKLHLAAFKGRLKIVQILLDHGAIVDAENDEGETPLNLVSRGEYDCQIDGVGIAQLLLERGAGVNAQKKGKTTPLHSAAFKGRLKIVRILLNHGAIADAENDEGETPLNLVSRGEYNFLEDGVTIARLLLERGVDVNAQKKGKTTALHSAAFKGRLKIVRILLDHGAIADAENDEGETPLNLASRGKSYSQEDDVGIAQLLLERGVDDNAQKKGKTTALHSAAFKGRLEIVRMLLDHGAIADAENDEGETPLNLVSRGEYDHHIQEEYGVGIARLLVLKHGVDVNAQSKGKTTALHSAAFKGRLRIVQMLLDHGAIADAENDEGETPLNLVSRGEYASGDYIQEEDGVGIARLLVLKHGVDVNAQSKGKTTALHSAAFKGRLKIVQILLDHGAIADAENDEGETPLNLVLRGKSDLKYASWQTEHQMLRDARNYKGSVVSIVRLFLERGVDVNAQDKYHNTPLHSAAFNRGPNIARLLLDHGANPSAENEQGETLLHEVSRIEDSSRGVVIARLLLEHGADVYAQDKNHNTALHSAAFEGRLRLAQVLLDHGANPVTENDQGESPLHLVSRGRYDSHNGGVSIAQLLLEPERGVDVNGRKRNKWTPLHLAAFKGRPEIARALLDNGANPIAADEQGETPLHVVSQGKYDTHEGGISVARLLLERGADVNAPDKGEYTPFDSASYFGRFDIARLFVEHGATDAEHASRGTRKADDVGPAGSGSEKKPKLHEDIHLVRCLAPWRHAHFTDINA